MNIEYVREYALTLAGANEDIIRPRKPCRTCICRLWSNRPEAVGWTSALLTFAPDL